MSKLAKDSSKVQSDIWSAIHDKLTDLSLEYKSTSEPFQMVGKEAAETSSIPYKIFTRVDLEKPLKIFSQLPSKEPVGEKIRVLRVPAAMKNSKASVEVGGVNHLNLIQIKGNPAHKWQPRVQSPEEKGRVLRPDLTSLKMNSLLLKFANPNTK